MATNPYAKQTNKQYKIPVFKSANDERNFRANNPYHDYSKEISTRFARQVHNNLKNNVGVSDAQMKQYKDTTNRWNLNFDQFNKEDALKQQKGYIDNLYNQQKNAQLEQIKAQRDKAIGGINQQKAELAPQYQQARNQADAVNQQNVQRLRELMAANGLSASGENVTANVTANNQRLSSINQLNLQEQQQVNDFDRRIADLNNPAEEKALIAAIEAERSRAMLDASNRIDDQAYQRERDSRRDAEWESEQKWNRATWDKEFKRRNAEWESQQKADRAWRDYTFKNMSASEKAQLEWAKAQYGEEQAWRMFETQYNGELARSQSQAELDYYKNAGFPMP